jgi:hypothetical protein
MRPRFLLTTTLMLAVGSNLSGCGAVFINQGSANYSAKEGVANPAAKKPKTKKADLSGAVAVLMDDSLSDTYPYGGASGTLQEDEVYSGKSALKCVLNANDYSGVIGDPGKSFDLRKAREDGYVLRFFAKGEAGNEPVMVGFTDSKEDNQEVEVGVSLATAGNLTKEWQKFEVPLKNFPAIGGYWDGSKMHDGVPVQWDKIQCFRFKDNKTGGGSYTIYVDEVCVVPPGK